MFKYITSILYQSIGAQSAIQQSDKVRKAITAPWDTKGLQNYEQNVKKTFGTLDEVNKNVNKSTGAMGDFQRAIRRVAIVVPVWAAFRAAMQAVFNTINSQLKFLVDLENAMVRIQIVGKGTKEELDSLKTSLVALSVTYGTAAADALKAATLFAQQGRTVQETFVLTRTAMIGAQVLGTDIVTTVNNLTAAVQGFNIPVDKSTSIIDKWINVERNFAVTAQDLADATKVVGATANQLGVSMNALLGDVTAVIEVTRKSGSEAGRGLQFIYARLLTTARPVIEQIAKVPFYLDAQKKATFELTGTFRSASDILDDLSKKWDTLTNAQKLDIAVSTGSKRNLTILNALMQNYSRSLDARIASITSAGQAEKAFGIVQDSVAFKTKQVASAWNALTFAIADTSVWKAWLDISNKSLIGLTSLINASKALAMIRNQEAASMLAANETRRSELDSLQELIDLRDKLLKEPPTDKNVERIKQVGKAIEKVISEFPMLKIDVEEGNIEELKKKVINLQNSEALRNFYIQTEVRFRPSIDKLQSEKKHWEEILQAEEIGLPTGVKDSKETIAIKNQISSLNDEIKEKEGLIKSEAEKQWEIYKAQNIEKQLMLDQDDDIEAVNSELTASEKEQLEIERQLNNLRISGEASISNQLLKEIELVKNSKFSYDAHQKNLKVMQLENQLLDEKLKKRVEEKNKIEDLALQYEKATDFERTRIRRVAELSTMTPDQLKDIFKSSAFDKNLIIDYWSTFSEEGKKAIQGLLVEQYNLPNINVAEVTKKSPLTSTAPIPKYPMESTFLAPPTVTNDYNIDIKLAGAITDKDIQRLFQEIEDKIKAQPSYIDSVELSNILSALEKNAAGRKRAATILRTEL